MVRLLPVRHARRVLLVALLSAGQRDGGVPREPRDFRRRLRRAPARRAGVRAHRRPGRPQVHVSHHHRRHGPVDSAGRRAADLRADRHLGADPAGDAAPRAGARARRRVRRRGDLRRRARATGQARLLHELDTDHGDARLLPLARRHPRLPPRLRRGGIQGLGLARPVPDLGRAAGGLGLHPVAPAGIAGVRRDESRGQALARAADGELRAVAQCANRADRAVRRHRRPGRRLVHGPVLRALLPAEHAEARFPDGLSADRRGARDRHAVLRGFRAPVRPHRAQAHHGGRLPACGAHLHPDLQGAHANGEPGARGIPGARSRDGRGQRLPVPHVREAEDRL